MFHILQNDAYLGHPLPPKGNNGMNTLPCEKLKLTVNTECCYIVYITVLYYTLLYILYIYYEETSVYVNKYICIVAFIFREILNRGPESVLKQYTTGLQLISYGGTMPLIP